MIVAPTFRLGADGVLRYCRLPMANPAQPCRPRSSGPVRFDGGWWLWCTCGWSTSTHREPEIAQSEYDHHLSTTRRRRAR